ncbi:hypothetical protein R6Q59_025780 [Mikania micrantha]
MIAGSASSGFFTLVQKKKKKAMSMVMENKSKSIMNTKAKTGKSLPEDEEDGVIDEGYYRDHNQDDSDSNEHNKSVQVESEEEEEEHVRRTGKKAPAKRWSSEEEVALARSWLTISENPNVGNAQKMDGFYKKLTDHFHHLMKDNSRTVDQIYFKWNDLNSAMKKWNGFYQHALMNRKSDAGDEHVLKKAMKNYKNVVKSKGFPHIQAWEMVRDNSL